MENISDTAAAIATQNVMMTALFYGLLLYFAFALLCFALGLNNTPLCVCVLIPIVLITQFLLVRLHFESLSAQA